VVKLFLINIIKVYQYLISPFIGHSCRFYPSCSHYTITSVERFGIFKGLLLAVKRISKCHPFHEGGIDPVPEKK